MKWISAPIRGLLAKGKKICMTVIYVQYDPPRYGDSFARLTEYLAKISGCNITYVIVDNKLGVDSEVSRPAPDVYLVPGDNTYREFSGWQKGVQAVRELGIPTDLVLFTNEAFLTPGESFLKDFASESLISRVLQDMVVLGRVDSHGDRCWLYAYDVSSWVCTNCMFVPWSALEKIPDLISVKENLYDFVEREYPEDHLLYDATITGSDIRDGRFVMTGEVSRPGRSEIRIELDKSFCPSALGGADNRQLGMMVTDIRVNNRKIDEVTPTSGWYPSPVGRSERWIAKKALAEFLITEPGTLAIHGFLLPQMFNEVYEGELRIQVFDDSLLFKPTAPISPNYRRILLEWLTQRWHSSFEIDAQTWELFKAKLRAIFNEALLSAKFVEQGYDIVPYGGKLYY